MVKRSHFTGKSSIYDCDYDETTMKNLYSKRFTKRQAPPVEEKVHTAFMFPDFRGEKVKFPAKEWHNADINSAMKGETIVYDTEFVGYNRICGSTDSIALTNPENWDHAFPIRLKSSNIFTNVNVDDAVRYGRPDIKRVNIADCVDLHCDGKKKVMLVDEDGSLFGGTGATMIPESEYEWHGHTKDGVSYADTRDGLGDYRVPKPMQVKKDGKKIPMSEVYTHPGIIRTNNCIWKNEVPGWLCPRDDLKYHDLIVESMDEDHERRRLTPLAVRSDSGQSLKCDF